MTVDLTTLWHTNRRWRAWMDANTKFVTPETLDCLRLALVASTRALDCWLRQKNPDHARNNGREHTVESELADTAMLLLTALPGHDDLMRILKDNPEWGDSNLDSICLMIGYSIVDYKHDQPWTVESVTALLAIAHYPGLDLAVELDRCWRRLAEIHGRVVIYHFWLASGCAVTDYPTLPMPWLVEES